MNGYEWVLITLFVELVFGLIGIAIGNTKGRAAAGFVLGLLLGPIGLLITAVLDRTPAEEARRTREVQRLNGMSTASSPTRTAPSLRPGSPARGDGPPRWSDVNEAAQSDEDPDTIIAVRRAEERFRTGILGPHHWFFAEGSWSFVGQLDKELIASNPREAASVELAAGVTFEQNAAGDITSITLGGRTLTHPRPARNVSDFIAATEAVLVSRAQPPETSSSEISVREALIEVDGLRASNLITEQEHAAKRAEILARL